MEAEGRGIERSARSCILARMTQRSAVSSVVVIVGTSIWSKGGRAIVLIAGLAWTEAVADWGRDDRLRRVGKGLPINISKAL